MRYLAIDLEVGKRTERINALAAVDSDDRSFVRTKLRGAKLSDALHELDDFAERSDVILGHNLIHFDLPHLRAAAPDLRLLGRPALDTLMLSPLAFPKNPYHRLVKHYQDGDLVRERRNDPEHDARLALMLFEDERTALGKVDADRLLAWHWLTSPSGDFAAFDALFKALRFSPRPTDGDARDAIDRLLAGKACATRGGAIVSGASEQGWPLAYVLAWLSVAGGNSVMPPWVRHQFPQAGKLLAELRDQACTASDCGWCREVHDAGSELRRWFGFDAFRAEPATPEGGSMQRAIVEKAMAGGHVLGLLPTGSGKSLCYQVPALSRYHKTGALTVVISPLVALMADQVAGLQNRGIGSVVTVNGMLSMPERVDALDRIRLGDAGIVLTSPEQLRNRGVVESIKQREIGSWVLDEAHCLSSWGHDFRPDYRYVGRFIRERSAGEPPAPVVCLTATAKPAVVEDILRHFREEVGIELQVFNGGAQRDNLAFEVVPTSPAEKLAHIDDLLHHHLPAESDGGAIVYCSTQRRCQEAPNTSWPRTGGRLTSMRVFSRNARSRSRTISSRAGYASSWRPTRSAWASTSRTCGWSFTPTFRARWRTTSRKPAAPVGTPRRPVACFSTRQTTWNASSGAARSSVRAAAARIRSFCGNSDPLCEHSRENRSLPVRAHRVEQFG